MADPVPPKMVLPPPAPQNELEGLQKGYQEASKEVVPEKGASSILEQRVHPDRTVHPTTKRFQSKY